MTDEELQKIANKISANTATQEEKLLFIKQYNELLIELNKELKK